MRVIFLSPHSDPQAKLGEPDAGGQCIYEHELAKALASRGIEVLTFCRQRNKHPPISRVVPGYTIFRITAGGEEFIPKEIIGQVIPEFCEQVAKILSSRKKKNGNTIFHSHYWDGAASALWLKANYKDFPFVWTPHSLGFIKRNKYVGLQSELNYRFIPRLLWENYAASAADKMIVLSRNEKTKLIRYYAVKGQRVAIIAPGVTIETVISPEKYLRKWKIKKDSKILMTLGRMSRSKGYHHAIRILSKLINLYTGKVVLVIVGGSSKITSTEDTKYHDELRRLARRLNLENQVIFQPSVPHKEVGSLYSLADIYLMTAEEEPFGMTVVEAMIAGKTIIAHDQGGTKDILENNSTGIITNMHKYDYVADRIAKLLNSPNKILRTGKKAQVAALAKYSWESKLPQFIAIYQDVLKQPVNRLTKLLVSDDFFDEKLEVSMKYFLKGDYYFDIDLQNQLRIAGPQNHLLLGLSFPSEIEIQVLSSDILDGQLVIELSVNTNNLVLSLPLVTDIRTLRSYTEEQRPAPTYPDLVAQRIKDLLPNVVLRVNRMGRDYVLCKNTYLDDDNTEQEFGAYVGVETGVKIEVEDLALKLNGSKPLKIWIETLGTLHTEPYAMPIFRDSLDLPSEYFSDELKNIFNSAAREFEYLIRARKTSGFEYGTIFPRDWIESADLGKHDLTQATIDYMYKEAMRNISESGEGWHEDLVGAYRAKIKDISQYVDRKMIDIEPKYVLGLRAMGTEFLTNTEVQTKLRLVANYLLNNAENNELITFKKDSQDSSKYHFIGNWRDSYHAYPRQKSPLAPYDVNCVLYPIALQIIRDHADYFGVDVARVTKLLEKWSFQKEKFRLFHPDGIIGYSLALHGAKNIPLPIAHTDEAYNLFYGNPSIEETVSFARKLINPDYFYTPVGPMLVASDEEDFTPQQYHGKVIWPKQTAYCVAGLTKQYLRGSREAWPENVLEEIKSSVMITAQCSFRAFGELNAIPELYYYDHQKDEARLYTDQVEYEGQMSIVQLWSSIGARRIMRDYAFIQGFRFREEEI